MKFSYLAKTAEGEVTKGAIEAPSKKDATEALEKENLTPISIGPVSSGTSIFKIINEKTTFIPLKDKVLLVRQLSTLISAGVPISQAMHILSKQTENKKLKASIDSVSEEIEGGTSLSKAFEKQGKVFSPLVINMIRAGEVGGTMDESLDRVATELEKEHALLSGIRGAMIYPVAILVLTVGVLVFMIMYLIPQMTQIFASLNAELPSNLKMLLALSEFLKKFGILVLFGFIGLIWWFRFSLDKNQALRLLWHKFLIHLPVFGTVMKKINIARFSRNLSSLLSSGVTVLEAMEVSGQSLSNEVYKSEVLKSIEKIKNGSTIADALRESKYFPIIVCETIAIGEETGATDKILSKLTEFYEEEVETITKGMSDLILPVMMILIGIAVGLMFYSVIVPLESIGNMV